MVEWLCGYMAVWLKVEEIVVRQLNIQPFNHPI
jgi:hypothetical protein